MAEMFAAKEPARIFEMFIAEQNMVEVALELSLRGTIPPSTFAALLTRAFDQIRMSQYSQANLIHTVRLLVAGEGEQRGRNYGRKGEHR